MRPSPFWDVTQCRLVVTELYVLLTVHLDMNVYRKTNLMHSLFLVYFVNLYMFWALSRPIIRKYNRIVYNNGYLLFFLDDCCPLGRIISTNCIHTVVPPDDGPRYARNM